MHLVEDHGEREHESPVDAGINPRRIRVPPEQRAPGRVLPCDPRDLGAAARRNGARAAVVAAAGS